MSTVTRLYLIRHGATMLTAEDRFAGATNVALSDEGRRQAAALAARLKSVKLSAIYASPLDRTMETASILAAPHRLEVQPRDGLREISHGRWEGMTRAEVLKAYPDEVAAWDEDRVKEFSARLAFKDRIYRERWVEQARKLVTVPATV